MPFRYWAYYTLPTLPKVATGECVRLVQMYAPQVGHTTTWRAGERVVDILERGILSTEANASQAELHVACPGPVAKLIAAAPVLGPPREPWGELRDSESTRIADGGYVNRYDLAGGVADQLEKSLVCHYRDRSRKVVKLPDTTRECRIAVRPDGTVDPETGRPRLRVIDVTCSLRALPQARTGR